MQKFAKLRGAALKVAQLLCMHGKCVRPLTFLGVLTVFQGPWDIRATRCSSTCKTHKTTPTA